MYKEVYETVLVTVSTASSITKFTHKPKLGHFKCVGIDFDVNKTHATKALCNVGGSFNNQKSQIFNSFVFNRNSTADESNRVLAIDQNIDGNSVITGYVQDLAAVAPTYYVRIIFKFLKNE